MGKHTQPENFIGGNIVMSNKDGVKFLSIPEYCPYCGGKTIIKNGESGKEFLYCENSNTCKGTIIKRLSAFVSKQAMDILKSILTFIQIFQSTSKSCVVWKDLVKSL